jgi:hypothetical protein
MTYSGAHLRPCSRNPIPHSSAPSIKVESLYIAKKSGSSRGVNELNCRGVALTTLAGKKGNKHKTGEIAHATRLRDSIHKVDPPETCGVHEKVGQAFYGERLVFALCGDLRKFGSFEAGKHGRCFRHGREVESGKLCHS